MAPSPETPRLAPTDFLTQLTTLFTSTTEANHGSVFLTQKALFDTPSPDADTAMTSDASSAPKILVRATNGAATPKTHHTKTQAKKLEGKKVKISTVIEASEAEDFFAKLADVCKGGMSGLRKRERKPKKKAKKKGGK
jgi:signal recognition particle subunit SRP14